MQIKAVLFDMFDTLILIDRNYEFYNQAVINMHNYVANQGVKVLNSSMKLTLKPATTFMRKLKRVLKNHILT